jgi:hypothetical protein
MFEQHLHIISFDIPYPANYGGVIDVFYKAKALTDKGIKVHLHCFEYNRKQTAELDKLFYKVFYYKRDISKKHLFKNIPYMVSTRHSEELAKNLLKDDYPILMEGLHTSSILEDQRFNKRLRIVRTHNIEHEYYLNLAKVENDIFKKYYFYNEANKLKRYEKVLHRADLLLSISKNDESYFASRFKNVDFIPAFHPHKSVNSIPGKGDYVLYHGNLSVGENTNVVKFLLNKIFPGLGIPLKIAGLNPSRQLKNLVSQFRGVELIENPDDKTLTNLIKNAQINIAITAQATGLKLKLLNTLYNGRFCIVNDKMLSGSKLDELCIVANDAAAIKREIIRHFNDEFTNEHIEERKLKLRMLYNNGNNVEKLIELINTSR